jgi:hypothetical protein
MLGLLAFTLLAMAAYHAWGWMGGMDSVAALRDRGVRTEATIVDIRSTPGGTVPGAYGTRRTTSPIHYVTYRYTTREGATHQGVWTELTTYMPHLKGDTLPILYLPEQPNLSIALDNVESLRGQLPLVALLAAGGLLAALGAFLARNRENPTREGRVSSSPNRGAK